MELHLLNVIVKLICKMKGRSRKLMLIVAGLLLVLVAGYFIWQKYKYQIVGHKLATTFAEETDNLYSIKYDSLQFDEATGNASLKNIRITADTNMVKNLNATDMPYFLLNVTIRSIVIRGVKTAKALAGKEMVGDSVIIDHPDIIMYSLKPLQKGTKVESEAEIVYKEILGKLNLINVGFVFVNNVNIKAVNFYSKEKNFDFINGKFVLEDVLIDSAHNLDTNRVLFCKQAAFKVDSFFSYNNNRRELSVRNINFLGKQKTLLFSQISLDRFENDEGSGIRLLDARDLLVTGINSNQIVKYKNLIVDTIVCNHITLYQLPVNNLKSKGVKKTPANDSAGFKNVYSVMMRHLSFPKVDFVPFAKSKLTVGNIAIKVNDVQADKIGNLETHPADYSKEVEVAIDYVSMKSKDASYNFNFKNVTLNSLRKELKINSFNIIPFLPEKQFAAHFEYQKDRYDVQLTGISLKNIEMNDLINKKLLAAELVIDNTVATIYRDQNKPLEQKSKIGNYPSQLLAKLDLPINVANGILKKATIEYRENQVKSGRVGIVNFLNSKLNISNITNIPVAIRKNKVLTISFNTKVFGSIPLDGNFKYRLDSDEGNFTVTGHIPAFDAIQLNRVSVPMGLIKINTGKIGAIDFDLAGNNNSAKGDFVMKYEDLKVEVLKRDKDTKKVTKKGLASFAANMIVKNNNPDARGLRKVNPEYKRNIYKSFFNLVWKTIFTGMKETVGLP